MDVVKVMDEKALHKDHKAFFGSIFATLNHVLWGDTLWMSRFCNDVAKPDVPGDQSTSYTKSAQDWQHARFSLDGRIRIWAETLSNVDLAGDLIWYSGLEGRDMSQSRALLITHMFNHQTHHRGQVHAMLTASGQSAPVTDLCFMPENA